MKKFLTGILIAVLVLLPNLMNATDNPQDVYNETTLAELRQAVKNQFLVMTDALFPDSVLDDAINQGCKNLAGHNIIVEHDTIIWVANTKSYVLPVNFLDFIAIYPDTIAGAKAFDYIHPKVVGKIAAAVDLTSPRYVWVTGKSAVKDTTYRLWFYPAPTAVDTLELIYAAEAIELINSTDTTNIPYKYVDLIGYYAIGLCYAKSQNYNEASWYFALYDQMLRHFLLFEQKQYDYIIEPKVIRKP